MHGYRVYSQSVSEILSVTGFLHIVWIGSRWAVIIFPSKVLVIAYPLNQEYQIISSFYTTR